MIRLFKVMVLVALVGAIDVASQVHDSNARLTKQNTSLEKQLGELKKANGQKWTFISNVSFDSITIDRDAHANIDNTFCDHSGRLQSTDEDHEYCISIR